MESHVLSKGTMRHNLLSFHRVLLMLGCLAGWARCGRAGPVVDVYVDWVPSNAYSLNVTATLDGVSADAGHTVGFNLWNFIINMPPGSHGTLSVWIDALGGDRCVIARGVNGVVIDEGLYYPTFVYLNARLCRPMSVTVGDFNGDGKPDLAVTNNTGNNVTVPMGLVVGALGASFVTPIASFAVGRNPVSVAVGDFNGDRLPDLAVANSSDHNVSVLLGTRDGAFWPPQNFAAGSSPAAVVVGDLNGDGKPDLAVVNAGSDSLSVLLGKGDGTFQAASTFAVGINPTSVVVRDLNDDGKPDLAVTNWGLPGGPLKWSGNTVSVLLGNGLGDFQAKPDLAVGYGPTSIAAGDFDGDGKPDLAVSNQNGGNVSILLGEGEGTFRTAQNLTVGRYPTSIVTGDFDGDGKPDLAVANQLDNNVSVLLGNGNGTFQLVQNFSVGLFPSSVVVGDFDGDGKPDLAVTNFDSNNLSMGRGKGDGTFNILSTNL